jgi:flagellar assembly factor FliW
MTSIHNSKSNVGKQVIEEDNHYHKHTKVDRDIQK